MSHFLVRFCERLVFALHFYLLQKNSVATSRSVFTIWTIEKMRYAYFQSAAEKIPVCANFAPTPAVFNVCGKSVPQELMFGPIL